jgi:SAM-dependent methyltransferase
MNRYTNGNYLINNSTWHAEDSLWKSKQILQLLKYNNMIPSTICEVGCGAGQILLELSKELEDTKFFGFEISPQAYALCKVNLSANIKYYCDDFFTYNQHYECILCIDVFEHIEDYFNFLRKLKNSASNHIFHIPLDISILGILKNSILQKRQELGHLHYFNTATALETLKDCGFEILDYKYTTPFFDFKSKTFKSYLLNIIRKILYKINPNLMVNLLGGCSLIVLTR